MRVVRGLKIYGSRGFLFKSSHSAGGADLPLIVQLKDLDTDDFLLSHPAILNAIDIIKKRQIFLIFTHIPYF